MGKIINRKREKEIVRDRNTYKIVCIEIVLAETVYRSASGYKRLEKDRKSSKDRDTDCEEDNETERYLRPE